MERLPIPEGPLIEETMLSAHLDYYKPTMSQVQHEKYPDEIVTFTFHNRGTQRIADHVSPQELQERFDQIREQGWSERELAYLADIRKSTGERMFSDDFISYLATHELPEVRVGIDDETDDVAIKATGAWPVVTFWETVVMGQVSELYFAGLIREEGLDVQELYAAGDQQLDEWTDYLQAHPDVQLAEFGTRRHFSLRWQKHVIERLGQECPDNLIGTSNVGFAQTMGMKPLGTFAHEMPMVYAGIADARGQNIRASHDRMLDDWEEVYAPDLLTALSDTFTSKFFFDAVSAARLKKWEGTRQDSGDPLAYAALALARYAKDHIDPSQKKIMFSDSLDVQKVGSIHEQMSEVINDPYGVGTALTNHLPPLKPLNIVMKATSLYDPRSGRTAELVKLSDDEGKHVGPACQVERYKRIFAVRDEL